MFATIIASHRGKVQVYQFGAPTVKDCLVAWAGRFTVDGMDDEARTRLRGDMADFDGAPVEGFGNVWRLETDLGLGGEETATIVVVETVRH